jgi:hydrogenase-4 component E
MAVGQASLSAGLLVVGGTAAVLKGVVFPALLRKALRDAGVRKEIEPFVGYGPSLLLGVAMLPLSLWLSAKIFAPGDPMFFAAATSLTTMAVGLFLIVARRKALTQTIGYLAFENGIYLFGVAAVGHVPLLVEMGVLLDAFVAVFVMGIAIHHISREFDHIDADQLNSLKG